MTHGEAGAAARAKADNAARAAEHLEQKAARARDAARRWSAGADGESAVAEAVAPLAAEGWFALHDRVMPTGGNIDHILVGPGSVIVLDAKAWNGHLEVRNGRLLNSGWDQSKALRHLAAQRSVVQNALGHDGPVDMALVITTQPEFGPARIGEAVVIGIGHLLEAISSTRTSYAPAQVDAMTAHLMEVFPVAGTAPPRATGLQQVDGVEVGDLFDRANRFLYLNSWQRHGKHRIYVRDEDGDEFGWKDVQNGSLHLDRDDDVLVRAVLKGATPTGLRIEQPDVPKLRIPIRGGRLLSLFGRLYCTAIVGSQWRKKGYNRLYGTLVNPTDGVFDLGHVDMDTGWVRPASTGPLSRDRGPAERYLALLRDRSPFGGEPTG